MPLIEKIARAIHRVDAAKGHDYDKMDCVLKARFEHIAQAALTAIMGEGDGVQQCDRDAAAKFIAPSDGDFTELAALFARHRSTAAAAERARIVAWLRNRKEMTGRYIDYIETEQAADCIEGGEV